MGVYVSSTAYSLMLPGFLKGNTTSSDTFGTSMFDRQVLNAEGLVNACIAPYYSIADFTAIPPLLRKLTEDIAIYNVIKATGYRADDRNEYLVDFRSAIDTLNEIKEGKIKLTDTAGATLPVISSSRFLSDKTGFTPIFGLDAPFCWKRDDDEIDETDASRR